MTLEMTWKNQWWGGFTNGTITIRMVFLALGRAGILVFEDGTGLVVTTFDEGLASTGNRFRISASHFARFSSETKALTATEAAVYVEAFVAAMNELKHDGVDVLNY